MLISSANSLMKSLALLLVATLFPVHLLALDRAVKHLRSRKKGSGGVGDPVHDCER
jgi:hypothetical protein